MDSANTFLPTVLLNNKNEKIDSSEMNDLKAVCFYFVQSNYPHDQYDEKVKRFYNHINKDSKQFEVIIVSLDETFADFKTKLTYLPFLGVQHKNRKEWMEKCNVVKGPKLLFYTPDGNVLADKVEVLLSIHAASSCLWNGLFENILANKVDYNESCPYPYSLPKSKDDGQYDEVDAKFHSIK